MRSQKRISKNKPDQKMFQKQTDRLVRFDSFNALTHIRFQPASLPRATPSNNTPTIGLTVESILGRHANKKMCHLIFFLTLRVRQNDHETTPSEEEKNEYALVQELLLDDLYYGRARQKQPQLEAAAFFFSLLAASYPPDEYLYTLNFEWSDYYIGLDRVCDITAVEQRQSPYLWGDYRTLIRYGVAETDDLPSVAGGRIFLRRSVVANISSSLQRTDKDNSVVPDVH